MNHSENLTSVVGLGVVGCGYWGPNLIRNFRALPGCNLRAMCDLDPERLRHLRELYPEVEAVSDFDEILQDPAIDAVAIATGTPLHYSMARASLLAGKHTLVEKPLARSSAECRELHELATRNGLVLMVGHTFLYSPAVRKIKEIIDSGEIGEVRYISARRLNLGLFRRDINVTWDLAPHDLSIILHLMGEEPVSVNCSGSSYVTPGVEDVTAMCLQFSDEKSAFVHSSWLDPRKIREMMVVGSKRMIVYDDVAPQEKIRIFDAHIEAPPHYDTYAEFHFSYHYGDVHIPYLKQEEPLKAECLHFVDCIRNGVTPITPARDGETVVRILEAASESLKRHGAPVDVAPSTIASPALVPAQATSDALRRKTAAA